MKKTQSSSPASPVNGYTLIGLASPALYAPIAIENNLLFSGGA